MILASNSHFVTKAPFPVYEGRQYYMASTKGKKVRLPKCIAIYEKMVQNLCNILQYTDSIHVTIDEKILDVNQTQRKPGPHVDGRFNGEDWSHHPGWNHYCNELPISRMAIAVASSYPGCKVYEGLFEGEPSEQGDLSHIKNQLGKGKLLNANEWHILSPDCIHESMPMVKKTKRQFIRVAFEREPNYGQVVELADTLALEASAFGRGGSTPSRRTIESKK